VLSYQLGCPNYLGLLAFVLAGLFALVLAGLFMLPVFVFVTGDDTGALTGDDTGATLVLGLLVLVLFAASPQAIPSAPKPRTVVSKITFFILSADSCLLLKDLVVLLVTPADRTQPFCFKLFLIRSNSQYSY
jgi:hypothetical protein